MGEASFEQRLAVAERQINALRRRESVRDDWIDTVSSSFAKRLWWWLNGYRFRRLGRWYRAPWNKSAEEWDEQRAWPPLS